MRHTRDLYTRSLAQYQQGFEDGRKEEMATLQARVGLASIEAFRVHRRAEMRGRGISILY